MESPAKQFASTRRPSGSVKHLSQILGQEDASQEDLLFFRDSRMVAHSCNWIYDKEGFDWWSGDPDDTMQTSNVRYLWLKGKPAMGKSVLMSAVIDKMHSEGKVCAYYFFRFNNALRRTTKAFMLSVIAQLAISVPEFYERLVEIDQDHATIHSMSTRILWQKVFVDTLFELPLEQPWYLVLDGLDEAEKPGEVVSFVGKIQFKTHIKVLIASRNWMDLDREFQRLRCVRNIVVFPASTELNRQHQQLILSKVGTGLSSTRDHPGNGHSK